MRLRRSIVDGAGEKITHTTTLERIAGLRPSDGPLGSPMSPHNSPSPLTGLLNAVTRASGSPWLAVGVAALVIGYLVLGMVTGFAHWWQLLIHTTAAMITLPMLFVLQHTTNRETRAILIKLDELISATGGATEDVLDLEDREVDDQEELHDRLHHNSRRGSES